MGNAAHTPRTRVATSRAGASGAGRRPPAGAGPGAGAGRRGRTPTSSRPPSAPTDAPRKRLGEHSWARRRPDLRPTSSDLCLPQKLLAPVKPHCRVLSPHLRAQLLLLAFCLEKVCHHKEGISLPEGKRREVKGKAPENRSACLITIIPLAKRPGANLSALLSFGLEIRVPRRSNSGRHGGLNVKAG